ncbi:hypothetical protein TPV1_gp17 [Thermococcus prieurii virus 1]|uniref:hypothetical protein n=1 Tax=Thermococcus prieurii virus 1 TaxID=1115696 RepID=UPI00024FB217|nr:hypothetical protein TPV1_gp17 [Thermococcus prieurii virus 1]AEY69065.1 hypothetical protein [Thermococcus prieurii virus 1]AFA44829.1 hypothetical protein [Thermococcus prieurii virus 1]
MPEEPNLNDIIEEFRTEIDATPSFESHDVLIAAIKDNERYFPASMSKFTVLKNPGLALANLSDKEIAKFRASLAKFELLEVSKIPRWLDEDLRQTIEDFEQMKLYVDAHLSLARKGHLLDKITQISKIISYQANVPTRPKRRFSLFGFGGD